MRELKKYFFVLILILGFANFLFAGFAYIDSGQNSDTLYYSTGKDYTGHTGFSGDFTLQTMIYKFDILYDSAVFEFDTTYLIPGYFLTELSNSQTDTYIFLVQDYKDSGFVTIIGARLIVEDDSKGVSGLQLLIDAIKFKIINPILAPSRNIEVTNFKFYDVDGNEIFSSTDKILWSLFTRNLIGDINNDGVVNSADFSYFRKLYGKTKIEAGLYITCSYK
jgi:hypothetical protein